MEREADHVRMVDGGRLSLSYPKPVECQTYEANTNAKFQLAQHGNDHGISFFVTQQGFAMIKYSQLEPSLAEYSERRQTAVDRNHPASSVQVEPLAPWKEFPCDNEQAAPYFLSLSPNEQFLAVAYGHTLDLFAVSKLVFGASSSATAPLQRRENVNIQEAAWCPVAASGHGELCFVSEDGQVELLNTLGESRVVGCTSPGSSICWSPGGMFLAVGTTSGTIEVFSHEDLSLERTIDRPEACEEGFAVHHINWAEEDLILAGYKQDNGDDDDETALGFLFEGDNMVELDEIVGFYGMGSRKHQFYSCFLKEWRMFFIGCSLSADIELLVSDPDSGEWELWKPSEKYQARLPMDANDDDTCLVGMNLILNSSLPVKLDETTYPPVPIVSCVTNDGLLVNFSLVDLSVGDELDFLQTPIAYTKSKTISPPGSPKKSVAKPASGGLQADDPSMLVEEDDLVNVPADNDSEDSDYEEEMEEEREKAVMAFEAISKDGGESVELEDFEALMTEMGTTYCEEEHARCATKLAKKDGKIHQSDFVEWYVMWVFDGDDEDSDNEEEEDKEGSSGSGQPNLQEMFSMKEGAWRCDVCCVQNADPNAAVCAACETPNPSFKGEKPSSAPSGFSFGGSSSGSTPSFSFGFDAAAAKSFPSFGGKTDITTTKSSFSFGFVPPASSSSSSDITKTTSSSAPGFVFDNGKKNSEATPKPGSPKPSSRKPSSPKLSSPKLSSPKSSSPQKANSPTKTMPHATASSPKKVAEKVDRDDEQGYGKNDENEFADEDSDDQDLEDERREEEAKARESFQKVAKPGSAWIPAKDFAKLFQELGTVYCEEEHSRTLEKLDQSGKVYEDDFVNWYVAWILDELDEDDEEEEDENEDKGATDMKSPDEIKAAFAKFQAAEGSWKCEVCMVMNPDSKAAKCVACGTPNPNAPKQETTAAKPAAGGSIGVGGFSFGGASSGSSSTSTGSTAFGFSFPGNTTTQLASGAAITGFSFGGQTATSSSDSAKLTKDSAKTMPSAPNTTDKPKIPAPSTSGYPPDTSSKPKPPDVNDATSIKKVVSSGGYPPDTSSKPKPPAFNAASSYPPDTSSKPKPTAFNAASSYPPDTSSKPKPPAFNSTSSYPPDTSSKPKPPAFNSASSYPPDTSAKPKPPAFNAGSSYPPDTSAKPQPPAFNAASSYPPDTSAKPKLPAFNSGSSYPPDTSSKPQLPTFGQDASSTKPTSSFKFGSAGSSTPSLFAPGKTTGSSWFGSATGASASTKPSEDSVKNEEATAPTSKLLFPKPSTTATPSPFGVVPQSTTSSFSFGGLSGSLSTVSSTKDPEPSTQSVSRTTAPAAVPQVTSGFSFGGSSGTLSKPTTAKPAVATAPTQAKQAPSHNIRVPKETKGDEDVAASTSLVKGIPSSEVEAQVWKLIIGFDQAYQRVDHKAGSSLWSTDKNFAANMQRNMSKLQTELASLQETISSLDQTREDVEKQVLFVIGSDANVHEQIEYAREILSSFDDERVKLSLEEQPLDQRSKDTRENLQKKLQEIERCCNALDQHLAFLQASHPSSFASALASSSVNSAHLFRVLKQTYDSSKFQYNRAYDLSEQMTQLSLKSAKRNTHNNGVMRSHIRSGEYPRQDIYQDKDFLTNGLKKSIARTDQLRQRFLQLCKHSITPREVRATPKSKSLSVPTPRRGDDLNKAWASKLMSSSQMTIASPATTVRPSTAMFKPTPVKSGSSLFAAPPVAESKKPSLDSSSSSTSSSSSMLFGKKETVESSTSSFSNSRPSIPSFGVSTASEGSKESKPAATGLFKSTSSSGFGSAFSMKKSDDKTLDEPSAKVSKEAAKPLSMTFGSFGGSLPDTEAKSTTQKTLDFSAPKAAQPFGSGFGAPKVAGTGDTKPDYRDLLVKFYQVHSPAHVSKVDAMLLKYKGQEDALFSNLFKKYVKDHSEESVKKYLSGGPVPPKAKEEAATTPASTTTSIKSSSSDETKTKDVTASFGSFGGFGIASKPTSIATPATPLVAKPSVFGASATTPSTPVFGAPSLAPASAPASAGGVDYRKKLIEFYEKHNPAKLADVDSTLEKYKGREDKLFENLAVKYKVKEPATGAFGGFGTPAASAKPSPFGNPNAFAMPSVSTSSVPATSAFGKPSTTPSPFGSTATTTTSGFGGSSAGFPSSVSSTSSGFGSAAPGQTQSGFGFGANAGGFGAAPAFGAPSQPGAFAAAPTSGGTNYRDRLIQFYQQHNPAKLKDVDATLEKYRGNEEKLFHLLETKYKNGGQQQQTQQQQQQPQQSGFGGFAAQGSGFGAGAPAFGAPSGFGGNAGAGAGGFGNASSTPTFGSGSAIGIGAGAPKPAFGGSTAPAFGASSAIGSGGGGGGFGGTGFGAFKSGGFGSVAPQGGSGFGGFANNAAGGGGGGFGNAGAAGGFGQPGSFSGNSFQQMRS